MTYTPMFTKPYPDGWVDGYETEVKADYLNMLDDTIIQIEEFLGEEGVLNERLESIEEDVSDLQSTKDITTTTSATMPNSHKGRLLIEEIGGVSEQEENPSSTNPQKIVSMVISEIRTHGEQLFDALSMSNSSGVKSSVDGDTIRVTGQEAFARSSYTIKGIKSLKGQKLTFACESLTKSNSAANVSLQIRLNHSDGTITYRYVNSTFEMPEDVSSALLNIVVNNTDTALDAENTVVIKGLMLNIGEALPWESYAESTITLSEPIELCGIGDAQDVLTSKQVKKRFKKVEMDGSEDEGWVKGESTDFNRFYFSAPDGKANGNVLCSQSTGAAISSNLNLYIDNDFATLEEWLAHLAESPMTIIYELAEETNTDLPTADQIALNSLLAYDGTTYAEFDSEIQPTFKGKYGTSEVGGYTLEGLLTGRNAEIQAKADTDRITALEAALINTV